MKKFFIILWSIFWLKGVSSNYTHYSLADFIAIIFFYFIPFIVIYLKNKKRKNFSNNIKSSIEKTVGHSKNQKNINNSLKKDSVFLEDDNIFHKVDSEINDEDIPKLIKHSYQERLKKINKVIIEKENIYPANTNKYKLVSEEKFFLNNFLNQMITNKIDLNISTERRNNGEICVEYKGCPVGRIRLQGRKHYMQILRGMYGHKIIEGNLEDFIQEIPAWIRYVKYLKRNWNK